MAEDPVAARLGEYEKLLPALTATASEVRRRVREALQDRGLNVHAVRTRVKSAASLREKLADRPTRRIEDLVGLRVITYYESDIPAVEAVVRSILEVRSQSGPRIDQQLLQRPSEFGYRSIQFVAHVPRANRPDVSASTRDAFGGNWLGAPAGTVEVQIRTVLMHGWAEVQHALVYKAPEGTASLETQRRLAMAAALTESADAMFDDARLAAGMPRTEAESAPAPFDDEYSNWLNQIVETHEISRRLDRGIAEALDVPIGHPAQARRQVGRAVAFAGLSNPRTLVAAIEEHEALARRAAIGCEDTSRSLISPDAHHADDARAEAYRGIGIYWICLVHACLNGSASAELYAVERGRFDEYAAVIRALSDDPALPATAVRDRYRRVSAPPGSRSFPPITI